MVDRELSSQRPAPRTSLEFYIQAFARRERRRMVESQLTNVQLQFSRLQRSVGDVQREGAVVRSMPRTSGTWKVEAELQGSIDELARKLRSLQLVVRDLRMKAAGLYDRPQPVGGGRSNL